MFAAARRGPSMAARRYDSASVIQCRSRSKAQQPGRCAAPALLPRGRAIRVAVAPISPDEHYPGSVRPDRCAPSAPMSLKGLHSRPAALRSPCRRGETGKGQTPPAALGALSAPEWLPPWLCVVVLPGCSGVARLCLPWAERDWRPFLPPPRRAVIRVDSKRSSYPRRDRRAKDGLHAPTQPV